MTVDRVWVHDTDWRGIDVEEVFGATSVRVTDSLVELSREHGLFVMGSEATVERTVVRTTQPRPADQAIGRGINLQACTPQYGCATLTPADVVLHGSLLEDNHDIGLLVLDSDATVQATAVRATTPNAAEGLFGDGVAVVSVLGLAGASVRRALIENSSRAGLSCFGAQVSLRSTVIRCAQFELDGEQHAGQAFVLEDRGANSCGCPSADSACQAVSAGLEPPSPVQ